MEQNKDQSGADVRGEAVAECRKDGRCQYAIDHGAEGMGHCPVGKCPIPVSARAADAPSEPSELAKQLRLYESGQYDGANHYSATLLAAADALDSQPTVPDGWVLVPKEPTLRMNEAGCDARLRGACQMDSLVQWRAMIAAAPTSSQPTDGGVRNGRAELAKLLAGAEPGDAT